MALTIMTNIASLGAQRNLAKTQDRLTQAVGRLSSGMRINKAGDDAAGLAITSRLSAQIRSLEQAQRNAQDGISMIQTAEGALGEMNTMLSRMRELAVQSANGGTLGTAERASLDDEYQALETELSRISDTTEYNGATLLDGSLSGGVSFQVGIFNTANDRLSTTVFVDSDATALGTNTTDITSAANAQTAITALDTALDRVSDRRGDLGALQNRLSITISNLGSMHENISAGNSRIMDADIAKETASLTRNQILMQAGISVLAQSNQIPALAAQLLG